MPDPSPPVAPTPWISISFGPGILEALPYADLPQATYPPPAIFVADALASTTRTTTKEIRQAASLQSFLASKKQ